MASAMARVGAMAAPYLADTESYSVQSIAGIYSIILCMISVACWFLPKDDASSSSTRTKTENCIILENGDSSTERCQLTSL